MNNEKILSNDELLDVTGGKNFVIPKFKIGEYRSLYSVGPVIDFDPHISYPEYAVAPVDICYPEYAVGPIFE